MHQLLQSGHPDADRLSAFAEHALPAHEHRAMLAHMAVCPDCRAVVFLAQQADAVAAPPQPAAARHPWFQGWRIALPAAAALACLMLFALPLRRAMRPVPPAGIAKVLLPPSSSALATMRDPPRAEAAPKTPVRAFRRPRPLPNASQPALALAPLAPSIAALQGAPGGMTLRAAPGGHAALGGVVTDASGATIAHALVTATDTLTGVQTVRETSAHGDFRIAPLQPGNYTVEAVAPGFQRLLQENVRIQPLQIAGLDLKLPVGGASQTVTVTNAPPSLETTNTTLGGAIENELYSSLPLSMGASPRDPSAFQYLTPGVQEGAPAKTASAAGKPAQGVYGGTGQTNLDENYVEGTPASHTSAAPRSADAVQRSAAPSPQAPARPAPPPPPPEATLDQVRVETAATKVQGAGLAEGPRVMRQPILPSRLAAVSTAVSAGQTLALDSAGALFRSVDAGVTWRPVPAQWEGKAVSMRVAPAKGFELLNDAGAVWTSADGVVWKRR